MRIGFSTTNGIISRLIKWLTRSKASHSYIYFKMAGEAMVLHATAHGVNMDYYPKFKNKNKIIAEYKVNLVEEKEQDALSYAFKKVDQPYDYLAIVGFLWVLILKSFGKKAKNPFPNRSAYFCSEIAIEALKAADFPGADALDRELTSPEDIMEFLDNHKDAELK